MSNNADVDFDIDANDMEALLAIVHTDYGDASAMPVFGGELNVKSMISMAARALRR